MPLGPHPGAKGMVEVRVFDPVAREIAVVPAERGGQPRPLARVHPDGLWEAAFPAPWPFAYRLRVVDDAGRSAEIDDPYRFPSTLSDYDLHLLAEGTHYRISERFGAHPARLEGVDGTLFAVWAPNARRVSVVGDWNRWDGRRHPMRLHPGNGVWELFIPGVGEGAHYKFEILSRSGVPIALKSDPYASAFEPETPRTASVRYDLGGYAWGDHDWMAERKRRNDLGSPLSVYELHLGSSPLPQRSAWAGVLRRHPPLRARGPAPARASGLGDAGVQLRPARSRQLPARQRVVLARALSRGWAARGRRSLHALSRLLAQGRRVGAQCLRRARESRRHCLHPAAQRGGLRHLSRGAHRRGRIYGLAPGLAPRLPGRPGLRAQVEHGVDARHARVHALGPDPSEVSPRSADLWPALRVDGKFPAAALPRRGRPRQGLPAQPHAGR